MRAINSNTFNGPTHITQGDVNHNYFAELLPVARSAGFDSHAEEHNAKCLPDTRTDLLRHIRQWIKSPHGECIYWLSGMAGTGKSTIARTVASWGREGLLSASFFFKRGESDRGHAGLLFTTIASQLASKEQAIGPHIRDALRVDPALPGKALSEQYEKLVLNPLGKVFSHANAPRVAVVIDALDECHPDEDIKLIIHILSRTKSLGWNQVRIFITSRPELPIRLGFKSIHGKYEEVMLQTISEIVIEHDIQVFVNHQIDQIRQEYNRTAAGDQRLPIDWPGNSTIQRLVRASVPLFIYAATVCRFIADRRHGNPKKQLGKILQYPTEVLTSKLDGAYQPVLDQLLVDLAEPEKQEVLDNFRKVVGSLIILADPLPIKSLAVLLGMDPADVQDTLDPLHSVLRVPSDMNSDSPVQLLHLSFYDFLVEPTNRVNVFWVDEQQSHMVLARRCLGLLTATLKKNICNLSMPGITRTQISPSVVDASFSAHVRYCCLFWVHHLERSKSRIADGQTVHRFLKRHFLHWLEALSLIGRISDSIGAINTLYPLADPQSSNEVTAFLRDARRFILNYQSMIDTTPLQLYSSALIFSPERSIIRMSFEEDVSKWLSGLPVVDEDWGECLQTLEGHTGSVRSVAFSTDGRYLVSASEDYTVKVWDAVSSKCTLTLRVHNYIVTCAVFSHNDKYIASASVDRTICVWDAITGKCLQTLRNDIGGLNSIAFSHDDIYIASASFHNMVRIWHVSVGERLVDFKGHKQSVNSVAFSPDDQYLASGSDDKTVRTWDAATGECLQIMRKHDSKVTSVAFSNDGIYLASASRDARVNLWDPAIGVCLQVIKLSQGVEALNCVSFSMDGKYLVTASDNATARIWSSSSSKCLHVFRGHSDYLTSVAYSSDGRLVASGSGDKTIKIWDTEAKSHRQTNKQMAVSVNFSNSLTTGNHRGIDSTTLSSDNKYLASSSSTQVKVWDVADSFCLHTLKGHIAVVSAVAFSGDNKCIVSSSGNTVKKWDLYTGQCTEMVSEVPDSVQGIAVSHDAARVVLSYQDRPVVLWFKGLAMSTYETCTWPHKGLAFSPDGLGFACASLFNTINIWGSDLTKCVMTLQGHREITAVAFSQAGTHLFSASKDHTVKRWDTRTGVCLQTFDIGTVIRKIVPDTSCLRTEVGSFALDVSPEGGSVIGYELSRDGKWITWNRNNLLWLPPRYRPRTFLADDERKLADVWGTTIAIGFESAQPLIITMAEGSDFQA